jgi:hypothetical protein
MRTSSARVCILAAPDDASKDFVKKARGKALFSTLSGADLYERSIGNIP